MSHRNTRRAMATTTTQARRQRRASITSSSTVDLSSNDNDNYSAVDDISDDEDDDEDDVFAVEEQAIMGESSPSDASTPRPHADAFDGWANDGFNEDVSYEDNDDDSDSMVSNDAADDTVWNGIKSDSSDMNGEDFLQLEAELASQRRVRFNVPSDDSSTESTEDDHAGMYPDIFVDQSTLDPSFRRKIEDEQDGSSDSESFWDHTALYSEQFINDSDADELDGTFGEANVSLADYQTLGHDAPASTATAPDSDEDDDLDGYETDGETTEEEELTVPPVCRKISDSSVSDDECSESEDETPVRRRKGQPRISHFSLDKLKKRPMAVYDPKTGKMMIFTPDRQRRMDISSEQFQGDPFSDIPWPTGDQMSPMTGDSGSGANLMLDSIPSDFVMNPDVLSGFGDIFGLNLEQSSSSMEADSPRESDLDPENILKVSDFLVLNEMSSDEEDDTKSVGPNSTPARPTTASSDADVLSHLNSMTVGAFRRNQVNSQLMLRNQASQDSLDFSGPLNNTAIRGIRSDRFDTAAAPLTPIRRHKKQISDLSRSPLEPISAKRKATAEAEPNGHKKQKSISDVGALHL